MQNVQIPAAQRRRVLFRQAIGFLNKLFPQVGLGHQQARGQVLFDLQPRGQRLRLSQTLLKPSKPKRVSEFTAMKACELK